MSFDYERYGSAFLAKHLHKLRVSISDQSDRMLQELGVNVPSRCISVVLFLDDRESASISQISDELDYSHQLINQRLTQLERLRFVRRYADTRDRRRSRLTLTPSGKAEAEKIKAALPYLSNAFDQIFQKIGVDLVPALIKVHAELRESDIADRVKALMKASETKTSKKRA